MVALKVVAVLLALTSSTLAYCIVTGLNPFLRRCNPAVCQNYALSAFHAHSVMQRGEGYCDFGALPGFLTFNVIKQPGERWQTAVEGCQLQNLLLPTAAGDTGHTRVLLLGDSVDAHMAQQWCLLLDQPLQFSHVGITGAAAAMAAAAVAAATNKSSSSSFIDTGDPAAMKNRDVLYHCRPSGQAAAAGRPGNISVGMFHLPGVHLAGPFHSGVKGNFLVRIPAALRAFNSTFGGPPDLVLVHSNFWDQSRMWEHRLPGYGHINKLMPDVVFSWSSNFSLLLSTTRELLPEDTLLATRTAAFPAFSANWLGRWGYIHQLNMAAVEVTRLHGLPVIDMGGMVFGLEPRQYLSDQHHPNKIVLEAANTAMNLLYHHKKRLAAERRAAALQAQLGQQGAAEEAAADSSSSNGDLATGSTTDQLSQEEQAPAGQDSTDSNSAAGDAKRQGQEQQQAAAVAVKEPAASKAGAEQQLKQPKQHSDAG